MAAALAMMSLAAGACPLPSDDDRVIGAAGGPQLAWSLEGGGRWRIGQPLTVVVRTCPPGARLQRADAWMPAHRHGINYRPGIEAAGEGRWIVRGLLLHMAGDWELRWWLQPDPQDAGRTVMLVQPLTLP